MSLQEMVYTMTETSRIFELIFEIVLLLRSHSSELFNCGANVLGSWKYETMTEKAECSSQGSDQGLIM